MGKRFGGAAVLTGIDFDLRPGEVHVLAGENGAGKSTLMRILSGVLQPDAGEVLLGGERTAFRSAHDAQERGIAMIHQELSLAPSMSVMDNLVLGREPTRGALGRLVGWRDHAAAAARSVGVLRRVGLDIDPDRMLSTLPLGARQLVEIAKALLRDASVLIMDEPTSALTRPEVSRLFGLIRELVGQRERPAGVIYISHRTEEIYAIADRITVLRDGRHVTTAPASALPAASLIHAMVGREIDEGVIRTNLPSTDGPTDASGAPALQLRAIAVTGRSGASIKDLSLDLRRGEIVGLAGLQGSGAGALLHALFGDGTITAGEMLLEGEPLRIRSPRDAMARGIALLTEDRATTGLCRGLSIRANVTMPSLPDLSPFGWMRSGREAAAADAAIATYGIRCRGREQSARTLSGGNQQKVALAKWLMRSPRLLLLHDPTRGVDIGARAEIYRLINDATARGAAVLLASSDLPELLGLSDRVIALHRGMAMATFDRSEATPHAVMAAAMGERRGLGACA